MKLRKLCTAMTLAAVMTVVAPVTAFAAAPAALPVCPIEDCHETQAHDHNGITCAGHYLGDGHDYHVSCSQNGCADTSVHEHDGCYYYGHCETSGNSCYGRGYTTSNAGASRHHGGGHHGRCH